jgi:hypothetical protein
MKFCNIDSLPSPPGPLPVTLHTLPLPYPIPFPWPAAPRGLKSEIVKGKKGHPHRDSPPPYRRADGRRGKREKKGEPGPAHQRVRGCARAYALTCPCRTRIPRNGLSLPRSRRHLRGSGHPPVERGCDWVLVHSYDGRPRRGPLASLSAAAEWRGEGLEPDSASKKRSREATGPRVGGRCDARWGRRTTVAG